MDIKLTNEIVEKHGFKRINNSMWRLGELTLQNWHTSSGATIWEKLLSAEKAYKVCWLGTYLRMIKYEPELLEVMELNDETPLYHKR